MAQATNHEIDWRMLSETQLADEHMSVSYEPNLSAVARGKHPVQQIDYFDEATFESAFDAASRGLQPDSESSQHMGWKAFSEPRQQYDNVRMGQEAILNEQLQRSEDRNLEREEDTLATTAGQLLHKLKDEQNEKFQKSSFLSLMRQLRDKEVRVDGDKIIDVSVSFQFSSASSIKPIDLVKSNKAPEPAGSGKDLLIGSVVSTTSSSRRTILPSGWFERI